uniref:Uncharacterized protein n=1 Tax=Equus caballus TaxID=9796 RepID=A0A3Q2HTQ4_HORSE
MGTLGQCMENTEAASRLVRVQSRQNLMVPEPRSLNLFTRKPPRNVPPPPAGTTRYPPTTASAESSVRGHLETLWPPPFNEQLG